VDLARCLDRSWQDLENHSIAFSRSSVDPRGIGIQRQVHDRICRIFRSCFRVPSELGYVDFDSSGSDYQECLREQCEVDEWLDGHLVHWVRRLGQLEHCYPMAAQLGDFRESVVAMELLAAADLVVAWAQQGDYLDC
jgi:hypothetical protein